MHYSWWHAQLALTWNLYNQTAALHNIYQHSEASLLNKLDMPLTEYQRLAVQNHLLLKRKTIPINAVDNKVLLHFVLGCKPKA